MALPFPVIQVLFERGAFGPDDTSATSHALMAFAAGLPAFVMIKVFSPAYFAREDTKTPMWFAMISVAVNIAGALALFPFISYVGVALATTAAGWINALLLAMTLSRRGDFALDDRMRSALPRIVGASLAMGLVLAGLMLVCMPVFDASVHFVLRLVMLATLVATGIAVYFALAWWSGALNLAALKASFRRK
jgi:putative peptidoglycan lipid II flippase